MNADKPTQALLKQLNLTEFQLRNMQIMTRLLELNAVDDMILDKLRAHEIDFLNLRNKISLMEEKVNIDEKTHLLKYKTDYFLQIIKTASRIVQATAGRYQYLISFVRFDIDDFSTVNNLYGHAFGDEVLAVISSIIKDGTRPTDYVIRFGGEEFDVILPATGLNGTKGVLDRIFGRIREHRFTVQNKKLNVTVSAGVTENRFDFKQDRVIQDKRIIQTYRHYQDQADHALYDAKVNGKNQYRVYDAAKITEYKKIRAKYLRTE